MNNDAKFDKDKNWIDIWSKRDLTLLEKEKMIKAVILSQLSYLDLVSKL